MNYFFKITLMTVLLVTSSLSSAALLENKDYVALDGHTASISTTKDKIEVIEFFNYGCPYCYMVEEELSAWAANKPDNVIFTKIAISRSGRWVEYARLFYALGMISPEEQQRISPLIYKAIHEQKLVFNSAEDIFNWAEKNHVNKTQLEQYYYSNEVTQKLNEAIELAKLYNLKYVPSTYVNHQYQLILDSSNHYKGTQQKLNELVKLAGD